MVRTVLRCLAVSQYTTKPLIRKAFPVFWTYSIVTRDKQPRGSFDDMFPYTMHMEMVVYPNGTPAVQTVWMHPLPSGSAQEMFYGHFVLLHGMEDCYEIYETTRCRK